MDESYHDESYYDESHYDNYFQYQLKSDYVLKHQIENLLNSGASVTPEQQAMYDAALARMNDYDRYLARYGLSIQRYDPRLQNAGRNPVNSTDTVNNLQSQMADVLATVQPSDYSQFDDSRKFIGEPQPYLALYVGGERKDWDAEVKVIKPFSLENSNDMADSSTLSAKWDSAMGYIHGLAGAQGAYADRSDDYKFSWNLGNNAMRKLMGATEKVAQTAPPFWPGRGPTPSLELVGANTVTRIPTTTAPLTSIYYSSAKGNESKASDSKGSSKAAEKVVGYFNPINKGPLPDAVANSFRSATYSQKVLGEDIILYRAYGGKAKEIGQYWTRTKPEGPLQTVIDSALDQNWGNTATEVAKIRIPKGTTIYEGFAEKQGGLVGGGNQVYIYLERIDPAWLIK